MSPRRKVALYFGSFNPIHRGHISILRYLVEHTDADEVRIVVSPESPYKQGYATSAEQRLANVRKVISRECPQVTVSDVEFHLPPPLYTVNTLEQISAEEPDIELVLVMGGDNILSLDRWHRGIDIIQDYKIWVYPRKGSDAAAAAELYRKNYKAKGITIFDAELHDISSTMIRNGQAEPFTK